MTSSWLEHARDESARIPELLLQDERGAVLRHAIDRRLRRRRKLRRAALAGGMLALGAALLVANVARQPLARRPSTRALPAISTASSASWGLADGSRATALDSAARLRIERDGADGTLIWLEAGASRFDVRPRAGKPFIVRAGDAEVQVVGTHFDVSRLASGAVEVAVADGTVRVLSPAGTHVLYAGDRQVFAPAPPAMGDAASESAPASAAASPRALAVRDEPGALLAAADLARRAGRPQAAVAALRKLVRLHPQDPRAPSAAFSLGRVLLDAQHSPEQAAAAFATARKLDPLGPLAEDALAREVEAWASAGRLERARSLAELYLQRYPGGPRADFVRAHAGSDPR